MSAVPAYKTMGLNPLNLVVPLGQLPGVRPVIIRGHNQDIDIVSVPEDLIEQGGVYAFQTSAQLVEVLSSDADDDGSPAGNGARTLRIIGLDANYNEIQEDLVLNGTSAVPSVNSYLRINQLLVLTAGSTLSNEGTITARVAGGGATMCVMGINDSVSHQGIYTVPAGHTLLMQDLLPTLLNSAGTDARIEVQVRDNVVPDAPFILRLLIGLWGFTTNPIPFSVGFPITEKSDIRFRVTFNRTDNTEIAMFGAGLLVRTSTDSSS